MKIWRISNYADLSGMGGKLSEGRWNHLGTEIVYCSDHPSTCLLELLVRFDPDLTPETYQLLEISVPDDCPVVTPALSENWQEDVEYTRGFWTQFCADNEAPVLAVPSVIMPQAMHYLLNPNHTDHSRITIAQTYQNLLDERF